MDNILQGRKLIDLTGCCLSKNMNFYHSIWDPI